MSSYQYICSMQRLSKVYSGGKQVLKDINLQFLPLAKIGVVGLNGSGKTTLLRIMSGKDKDYTGDMWVEEKVRVGYLAQEPRLSAEKTVKESLHEVFEEENNDLEKFEEISVRLGEVEEEEEMNELIAEQGRLQEKIENSGAWELDDRIKIAMEALGCPSGDRVIGSLSGGEMRRVSLCRLLLQSPDLLLLDEPTNHLDAQTIAWLQHYLHQYQGTIVMVTHDRYFLDNVTGWILELDRGMGIPYKGNYSSWLQEKGKRMRNEKNIEDNRRRQMEREKLWVDSTLPAQRSKSMARIREYEKLVEESREALNYEVGSIHIPISERLGNLVVECEGVGKSYEGREIIKDFSFTLPRGGIVGIIGANGAGKTTLIRLITGQEELDVGSIKTGESVQIGYVDQSRDSLDDNNTIWQEISGGQDTLDMGTKKVSSRVYVASFNFKGSDQQKRIGQLSGGERNRVHLAKMLRCGSNLLIMDEPTNDLDLETLRNLEEAISGYGGSAIIVSHDRWFLDRIVTHIIAFEGEGRGIVCMEGNYQEYREDYQRRTGMSEEASAKLKYKRFARR